MVKKPEAIYSVKIIWLQEIPPGLNPVKTMHFTLLYMHEVITENHPIDDIFTHTI